ncbi:MAG: GntR family transcriptional regulator [Proteobacteria bacterium]|nr:GntR family transcriptional regulator [Pseudomonadota bacterium]MBU1585003.1 GntR family transcriptional regulator [Pseudomonadota bacterium]MBU2453935.1 GntR family transcriptional regulator [Pseudomonadota bacterium]MBU2630314.1 GntR family transcriptional regulator [Pseudomonadota bacterium]
MKKEFLKFKVYKSLRLDIVSGKLPGGTRLTEIAVADTLNVSRTPVREALQKLSQEQLLISIPKAGYLVEDLSDNDIQDLFTTRMEIEQIAIQKAIQFITVEELKNLDDNLERTKAFIRSKENFKITECDVEFHSILYKATRSKSLYRVCKSLSDVTVKYRHGLNLLPSLWNELLQQHIMIYQAIISKDVDKTCQAIALHARQAKSHLLDVMKKVRSDAFSLEEF